jgi:hypothetical protein
MVFVQYMAISFFYLSFYKQLCLSILSSSGLRPIGSSLPIRFGLWGEVDWALGRWLCAPLQQFVLQQENNKHSNCWGIMFWGLLLIDCGLIYGLLYDLLFT